MTPRTIALSPYRGWRLVLPATKITDKRTQKETVQGRLEVAKFRSGTRAVMFNDDIGFAKGIRRPRHAEDSVQQLNIMTLDCRTERTLRVATRVPDFHPERLRSLFKEVLGSVTILIDPWQVLSHGIIGDYEGVRDSHFRSLSVAIVNYPRLKRETANADNIDHCFGFRNGTEAVMDGPATRLRRFQEAVQPFNTVNSAP